MTTCKRRPKAPQADRTRSAASLRSDTDKDVDLAEVRAIKNAMQSVMRRSRNADRVRGMRQLVDALDAVLERWAS